MRTTSESSVPRFGCATVSSLLAEEVADPAAASASSSVIEPVIVIFPGWRTSPLTSTLNGS